MLESAVVRKFAKRLNEEFPGHYLLKNDANHIQGIPDRLFLYGDFWAAFEMKRKKPTNEGDFEPNQEWYIEQLDAMSFAACVYPENMEEVISAIHQTLRSRRKTLLPKR